MAAIALKVFSHSLGTTFVQALERLKNIVQQSNLQQNLWPMLSVSSEDKNTKQDKGFHDNRKGTEKDILRK